ncbi:MAG: hypothetical protein KJ077_08475 [Anaerolineae bacterium]|nr:hypothetical protein [Anaerolineae bacterium]
MTLYIGVIGNRDYIKYQGERRPFWEFLDEQPDGWLCSLAYRREDVPAGLTIWDCGAWSYKDLETPRLGKAEVTPEWAAGEYNRLARPGDFVVAPDHMILPFPGVDALNQTIARRRFNRKSAAEFIRLCPSHLKPMAVVHGLDLEERVIYARHLVYLGYTALALGGLAGQASKKQMVVEVVETMRQKFPGVWLHVLGVSSPAYAAEWLRLGVDSFDGASHFKQAFTAGKFFLEEEGQLKSFQAARPGEEITAPACECLACWRLRKEGIDTRSYGSNESNMGRAAHNLNQLMRAINVQRVRSRHFPLDCPTRAAGKRETRQPRYCAGCRSIQREGGWRCVWPEMSLDLLCWIQEKTGKPLEEIRRNLAGEPVEYQLELELGL